MVSEVLEDEMVAQRLITENDAALNAEFFTGTVVDDAVAKLASR